MGTYEDDLKSVRLLHASTLADARNEAKRQLIEARRCPRCSSLLDHVFDRIGGDVFLEDDPEALAQAFEPCDCDASAPTVLAAYVVLKGRHRVPAPVAPWAGSFR
jgi:hypothetical protein